jgi:predicted DNA-binding WGR domain protein
MACYLECSEAGAAKFWRCEINTTSTKVTFGKLGTSGTAQVKEHGSEAKAKQFVAKMKSEKLRKGYKEVVKADAEMKEADVDMKEVEPLAPQQKKRPAATAEEPPKKQQKTLPNDIPHAKRTTKSGALCLKGCIFIRTGRFNYQKALKDLVESYGGEFTQNAKKATHVLDGGSGIFQGGFCGHIKEVLPNGGAVVPLPVDFPGSGGGQAVAYLAKSMEISETIAKQEFRENVPLKHYRAALAKAFLADSDLMSQESSAYPAPGCHGTLLRSVETNAKKLLELQETTPSEPNALRLPDPVYLGNKEWCFN